MIVALAREYLPPSATLLGAVVAQRALRFGALLGVAAGVLGFGAAAYADGGAEHDNWLNRPFELGVSGSSIEHILGFPFVYCYTGTLGSLNLDDSNLADTGERLRALSGLYDQAARAAASL